MDTLTFGTPILLKHLTASEQKKLPVHQVDLPKALEGLGMNMDQFIDLCILLGCDYLDPIKGIGPKTALKLIREHGSLEKVIEHLKEEGKKSVVIPEFWPFKEARQIFLTPDVQKGKDLDVSLCRAPVLPSAITYTLSFPISSNGRPRTWKAWSSSSVKKRASGE